MLVIQELRLILHKSFSLMSALLNLWDAYCQNVYLSSQKTHIWCPTKKKTHIFQHHLLIADFNNFTNITNLGNNKHVPAIVITLLALQQQCRSTLVQYLSKCTSVSLRQCHNEIIKIKTYLVSIQLLTLGFKLSFSTRNVTYSIILIQPHSECSYYCPQYLLSGVTRSTVLSNHIINQRTCSQLYCYYSSQLYVVGHRTTESGEGETVPNPFSACKAVYMALHHVFSTGRPTIGDFIAFSRLKANLYSTSSCPPVNRVDSQTQQ